MQYLQNRQEETKGGRTSHYEIVKWQLISLATSIQILSFYFPPTTQTNAEIESLLLCDNHDVCKGSNVTGKFFSDGSKYK